MERYQFVFTLLSHDHHKVDVISTHTFDTLNEAKEFRDGFNLAQYGKIEVIHGEDTLRQHVTLFKYYGEGYKPIIRDAYLTIIPINENTYADTKDPLDDSCIKYKIEICREKQDSEEKETHMSNLTFIEARKILIKLFEDVMNMIHDDTTRYVYVASTLDDMFAYVVYHDYNVEITTTCGWRARIVKMKED